MRMHIFILLLMAMLIGGCRGSMTPGKMAWVQPHSDRQRAGNAYLLRGWIGLFSHGIDEMTESINAAGVRAHVYQDDQYRRLGDELVAKYKDAKDPEPLVLIGHSYGADDVIRVARKLNDAGITVDLLITMDPVTPPEVPKNVRSTINFYQPSIWDYTPVLRGIPLKLAGDAKGSLVNINLRAEGKHLLERDTNHINIDKNKKIHEATILELLKVCPPRAEWAARARRPEPATLPIAGPPP
jgi:pimeloyl-ACP methyl ester carboxylesterase